MCGPPPPPPTPRIQLAGARQAMGCAGRGGSQEGLAGCIERVFDDVVQKEGGVDVLQLVREAAN
jgi:hypothetical protein